MERYSVSLCIQSECGKIRIRKTPNMYTYHAALCKNSFYALTIFTKPSILRGCGGPGYASENFLPKNLTTNVVLTVKCKLPVKF